MWMVRRRRIFQFLLPRLEAKQSRLVPLDEVRKFLCHRELKMSRRALQSGRIPVKQLETMAHFAKAQEVSAAKIKINPNRLSIVILFLLACFAGLLAIMPL